MHLGGLDMGLTKIKLGKYIEVCAEKCNIANLSNDEVSGVNKDKEFFEPSNQVGSDTSKYKIVPPKYFACNLMHVGRDVVLPIAYNHSEKNKIVSPAYQVFKFVENREISSEYFLLCLKSFERDRYFWFNTDSSVRDGMSWNDFVEVEVSVPSLEIQQKYVNVYNAMLLNQQSYERGLEDLKLVCDAYIEELRREVTCEAIGPYVEERNEKNEGNAITLFQGVNVDHIFIEPKRVAEDSENGSIVRTGQFAFNKVMKAHNTKLPIALREGPDCVVSNSYQVFEVTNTKKLLPKYLLLWLNRDETQRYAGFISFGTTRDIFTFEDIKGISIPLPDINIQQSIVDIFTCFQARLEINEKLKAQIKNICPILIKGSIEEGRTTKG
jgi:hypothetical protein